MWNRLIGVIGGIALLAFLVFMLNQREGGDKSQVGQIGEKISVEKSGSKSSPADAKPAQAPSSNLSASAPKPSAGCFVAKFKHKPISSHSDGEACLHHDNAFKISAENVNAKSICVRVNGNPVAHKFAKGEVQLAAVAGPNSEVTVRYCTGSVKCGDPCKIAKDEFMDGLTAGGEGDDNAGAWGADDKQERAALEKEVKEFRGIASDLGSAGSRELFREWLLVEDGNYSCSKSK